MILNPEQQACVDAREGCFAVIAGPGSGKTSVLVQRHLNMIMSGISAKDILNLTFTNSAAKEMVRRIGLLNSESVFRTFHSFAMDLLKKEREHLSFDLCDSVIPVAMEDFKVLFDLVKLYPATNWRTMQEKINRWKCDNIDPDLAIEEATGIEYFYALAYREYEIRCRQQGWLDFDSAQKEALNLLKTNEEVRNRWKKKYIAVDEAQDCCRTQFEILQQIFDGHIFAVGDENQLIYEFRSAEPGNLTNFERKFPNTKKLYLGVNYRSTKALVSFLKEILPVDNGIASHMMTDNPEGEPPVITKYQDETEEAEQVLKAIIDPENTVVIARTNRQLFIYQRLCTVKKIKYKTLGKRDFWDQNEVKKILNLAKQSNDTRPAATVLSDLIQQYDLINLYKHSVTIDSNPIENLNSIVKMAAKKGTISEFLNYLRKLTGARRSQKGLSLSTGHQSKGLEFDTVFLVGAEQGRLPHKDGDLVEEKRIFFVMASRAANRLNISFSGQPSMFILPFKDKIIEYKQEKSNVLLQ